MNTIRTLAKRKGIIDFTEPAEPKHLNSINCRKLELIKKLIEKEQKESNRPKKYYAYEFEKDECSSIKSELFQTNHIIAELDQKFNENELEEIHSLITETESRPYYKKLEETLDKIGFIIERKMETLKLINQEFIEQQKKIDESNSAL